MLAHVFTDSVHYALWLSVIPEETLPGEGSFTFRMTWRALRRDFGVLGLALVFGARALLALFSLFGAVGGRDAYFAIAGFHGYLEGAMLVYLASAIPVMRGAAPPDLASGELPTAEREGGAQTVPASNAKSAALSRALRILFTIEPNGTVSHLGAAESTLNDATP